MANSSWFGFFTPTIVGRQRLDAQGGALAALLTFTLGSSDGTFEYGVTCTLTTAGSANFTATVAYTDESNAARTTTVDWAVGSSFPTAVTVAGQYAGTVRQIRAKAGTTITVATTGTFTGATYNIEAILTQLA